MRHLKSSTSCESCGKRVRANTSYIAYRPMGTTTGPWLIERLCRRCRAWYQETDIWEVRRTHPLTQMSLPGLQIG